MNIHNFDNNLFVFTILLGPVKINIGHRFIRTMDDAFGLEFKACELSFAVPENIVNPAFFVPFQIFECTLDGGGVSDLEIFDFTLELPEQG